MVHKEEIRRYRGAPKLDRSPGLQGETRQYDSAASMEDEGIYKDQSALFIESSDEKQIELEEIAKIVASLPYRGRFLDVGGREI